MKPKFSWEPSQGSLLLKVTNGDRETTWRVKKNAGMSDLYTIFQEVASAIDDTLYVRTPKVDIETILYDDDKLKDWLNSQSETTTEEESRQALAAKAASVTLSSSNWFGSEDDLSDLDLYVLGTGDPE